MKTPRATAQPCDEEDADGRTVRTWDVCRGPEGHSVASGFRTRAEARAYAAALNAEPFVPHDVAMRAQRARRGGA